MSSFLNGKKVCVTGGAGFLGRVVVARLQALGVADVHVPRSAEFDLTNPEAVAQLYAAADPDVVIHLAADVGGIGANQKRPGRYFFANMAMGLHLIEEARKRAIAKFVQVGTVCAYPKFCEVPFREEDLWSGFPEETNAPYGVAKRSLGVMLDAYRAEYGFNGVYLIPVNIYGPGDNFDLETSHVIPAMIRKFFQATDSKGERVSCWGSGEAGREFLYVDDAADAIVKAAQIHNDSQPINIGTGREIRIRKLAEMIAGLCGYDGAIEWDTSRPDGQPRRQLDTSKARRILDWEAKTSLEKGLEETIRWWRSRCLAPASMG